MIDGKSFFLLPVKNKEEIYEKILETSKNNDYTSGNLLDYASFKENYSNLITIGLSKKIWLKKSYLMRQINFIEELERQDNGATMFFMIEKSGETAFEFL